MLDAETKKNKKHKHRYGNVDGDGNAASERKKQKKSTQSLRHLLMGQSQEKGNTISTELCAMLLSHDTFISVLFQDRGNFQELLKVVDGVISLMCSGDWKSLGKPQSVSQHLLVLVSLTLVFIYNNLYL